MDGGTCECVGGTSEVVNVSFPASPEDGGHQEAGGGLGVGDITVVAGVGGGEWDTCAVSLLCLSVRADECLPDEWCRKWQREVLILCSAQVAAAVRCVLPGVAGSGSDGEGRETPTQVSGNAHFSPPLSHATYRKICFQERVNLYLWGFKCGGGRGDILIMVKSAA